MVLILILILILILTHGLRVDTCGPRRDKLNKIRIWIRITIRKVQLGVRDLPGPRSKDLLMRLLLSACCLFVGPGSMAGLHVFGQTDKTTPGVKAEELRSLLEKARAKHDLPALGAGIIHAGEQPRVSVVGVRKRGT